MAHEIADLTLDEVVLYLIAGDALQVSGGEEFSLSLADSRAILSFYNQDRRTYFNPDKDPTIQDGEIDRVLDALDNPPKAAATGARPAATIQKWRLGFVAFPGQTLIVSATAEVKNGDFAVVQTPGKTYARRIGIDKSDLSRIALETMPSTNPGAPPTHFVQRSSTTLSKVIGVLFDETTPGKSQDEAVFVSNSPVLNQVVAAAVVIGDSAFPVALDQGYVLLGRPPDLSVLNGRILAVVTQTDSFSTDHFAYLKRLGKAMPGASSVFYLENVGQSGEGEYVQFPATGAVQIANVPIVRQHWKVLGSIFG